MGLYISRQLRQKLPGLLRPRFRNYTMFLLLHFTTQSETCTSLEVKELTSVTQLLSVLALSSSHYTAATKGRVESIGWMHALETEQDMSLLMGNVSAF